MGTLAISENSDTMPYYAAFHQGLGCLFEIISRVLISDPSEYTIDHVVNLLYVVVFHWSGNINTR